MEVTFKNIVNKVFKFIVNETDEIASVVPKLFAESKIDPNTNSVRIIYNGQILEHSTQFKDFTLDPKLSFIFMFIKIKPVLSNTNETKSIEPINETKPLEEFVKETKPESDTKEMDPLKFLADMQKKQQEQMKEVQNKSNDLNNNIKNMKRNIISTLVFVRSHPQLFRLFVEDFQTLLGVMVSPQMDSLYGKLANHDVEVDDEFEDIINPESNNTKASDELTDIDKQNIQTLIALGFPEPICIKAYLVCHKNVDMAASMLFDSSN